LIHTVREFLFGSWIGDFERSRSRLVGDPISTNTLLEELFASLRMPYRIAPVQPPLRHIQNALANRFKKYGNQ
jgi:hypothetical protein